MEFSTVFYAKLVKQQKVILMRVSEAGGISMIVFALLAAMMDRMGKSPDLFYVGAVAGLCVMLVGWILRGFKKVKPLVTDTDIVISCEKIKIGEESFKIAEIEYIDFLVNSYNGMQGPRVRFRRIVLDGKDNTLFFTAGGKKHAYGFYLEDGVALRELGHLFRDLYRQRIFFRERNRGGRTFLFGQVNGKEELERAKRNEGFGG